MYNKNKNNRSVPKYICVISKPVVNPIANKIVVKDDEKTCVQDIIKKFDSARVNIIDMTTKQKDVKKMSIKDRYKELVKK